MRVSFRLAMCRSGSRSRAKLRSSRTVTVDGRTRQLVRFDVPIKEPGLYHGFVEVAAAMIFRSTTAAGSRFETRLPDRVLLIDGEPGPSVFGNETYYLETALRLRLPGDESTEARQLPMSRCASPAAARSFRCRT